MPPAVSVVLPTRDRLASLRGTLPALLCQALTADVELLVVDDGSRDGTADYLAGLARDGRVRHLTTPGLGAAAARNAGLRVARHPVVACTDDDCEVPDGWAAALAAGLESGPAVAVGGRVVAAPGAPRAARLSQAVTNGFVQALNRDPERAGFLTSNNVAYRAEAVRAAGLFDEAFRGAGGEERELHARLAARGGRLRYEPQVVVIHHAALSWAGFLRQQLAYGRGARLYHRLVRRRAEAQPSRLSASEYARAFAAALREARPGDRLPLMAALVLSQAAVAAGYALGPR